MHFAELVCDRAYVLEKGQIEWHGRMADLTQDVAAQRRLLSV
jgi:branched-chain amino acid transport system ATP-binding protein